jgi:hypothetical protein
MIKSPLTLARMALSVARESIPAFPSRFSPRRYSQHQLFALLALREFLKVDYRGLEQILKEWAELRAVLGLAKVPDHSTIPIGSGRNQLPDLASRMMSSFQSWTKRNPKPIETVRLENPLVLGDCLIPDFVRLTVLVSTSQDRTEATPRSRTTPIPGPTPGTG